MEESQEVVQGLGARGSNWEERREGQEPEVIKMLHELPVGDGKEGRNGR